MSISAARVTGGLYLAFILASVLATTVAHIGSGTPQQVYQTIRTDPSSFRLGLVIALISALLFLVTAWGLFVLLRPVDRSLALLFLLLNAVGVAVQCASLISLIAALYTGDTAGHLAGYTETQREALASLFIDVYTTGFVTAQLFFGTWLFPLGYLVYRSGILPRLLGVLLLLDGIGVLIWFFQALLLPAYPAITYPGLAVSLVAELALGLWLLVRGVRTADVGAPPSRGPGADRPSSRS